MTEDREQTMPGEGQSGHREDHIALLLRLAGPRLQAPAERAHRVKTGLYADWQEQLRSRRRRHKTIWVGLGLAAAASLAVVLAGPGLERLLTTAPSPAGPVGSLEAGNGTVRRITGAEAGTAAGPELRAGDTLVAGWDVATGPGDRAAIRLAGGSSVRLDTGTRVRLVSTTILELQSGAIYVDSENPAQAPGLLIRTPLGEVQELGTQFEVRLQGEKVRVRVRDGLVHLDSGGETYTAEVGAELEIDAAGLLARRAVPLFGPEWAWVLQIAPPFHLEGRSLETFLGWVTRETGWRTRFADSDSESAAPGIVLHGSVHGLRPDQALDAVLPTCGMRHRIERGTLIVGTRL
jgi:ferric-dicitrate binding protein FerR (iron transport regulator)